MASFVKWILGLGLLALLGAAIYFVARDGFPSLNLTKGRYTRDAGTPMICAHGEEELDGLCYPKCPDGYTGSVTRCAQACPVGYRDDPLHCGKNSLGRGAGTPLTCAPHEDLDAGLCYGSCPAGFRGVGPVCWKACPADYAEDPLHCRKGSYGRGVGSPLPCDDDEEADTGLCYPRCQATYTGKGPFCWQRCPDGFNDIGAGCEKPRHERGIGHAVNACPEGREQDAGLCYAACPAGYSAKGPFCWQQCPGGFNDIGVSCEKPTFERGVGKPLHVCPPDREQGGRLCYEPCKPGYQGEGPTCVEM